MKDSAVPLPDEEGERTHQGRPRKARWGLYIVGAAVLIADQVSKLLINSALPRGATVPVLGSVVSFTHARNTGAAFGSFSSSTTALTVISIAVVVFLLIFSRRAAMQSRALGWGIALQLGGAAGNLLDRVRLGYVTDFIDFHFWPVFNVADIGITAGALLMIYALLFDPALRDTTK